MTLTAAALTRRRARHAQLLTDTCVIGTPGARTFSEGGWSDASPSTVSVACRIGPISQREAQTAGTTLTEVDAVITLPAGTTIPDGGTITVGGRTYSVIGAAVRSQEFVKRLLVSEARGGA